MLKSKIANWLRTASELLEDIANYIHLEIKEKEKTKEKEETFSISSDIKRLVLQYGYRDRSIRYLTNNPIGGKHGGRGYRSSRSSERS